ncbi:hypothetical protein NEOC95_001477 [Neochlamydia sp. AcF95]|nr:hypothetical protein [Neochlamydia sp. AcF95]
MFKKKVLKTAYKFKSEKAFLSTIIFYINIDKKAF